MLAVTLAVLPGWLSLAAVLDECSAPSSGAGVGPALCIGSGSGLRALTVESGEAEEADVEALAEDELLVLLLLWRAMASCSLSAAALSLSSLRCSRVTSGSLPSFKPMSYGNMASAVRCLSCELKWR